MRSKHWLHASLCVFAAMFIAVGLAACGGGGSSSSSSESTEATGAENAEATEEAETTSSEGEGEESEGASGNAQVAEAEEIVKTAMEPPKQITLPALKKPPASSKSIVFITCPVDSCKPVEQGVKEATSILGWKLKVLTSELTPEGQASSLEEAIQMKPDGIIAVTNVPPKLLQKQLDQAEAAGIPIAAVASSEEPSGPIIQATVNAVDSAKSANLLANWVIAQAKGEPTEISVWTNEESLVTKAASDEFVKVLESCSNCKVDEQEATELEVGTKIPGRVVSYLQQNPGTEYMFFPGGATTTGVGQAIKEAGLPPVAIMSRDATPEIQTNIANELETASVGEELIETGFRGADVLARNFNGEPTEECCSLPESEEQLLTKENIEDPSKIWQTPEYAAAFEKIWGK